MTDYFGSKNYGKLSHKAELGRREYDEILKYEQRQVAKIETEYNEEDLKYNIINDRYEYYRNLLIEATTIAIEKTGEYNRLEKFSDNLINAINYNMTDILMAIVSRGVYGIYDVMERVAGGMSDFWDGVENAREEMELGGGNPEQRARYWKNKVWNTEEMYEDTIYYRFQAWQDYAPYWYWIEHGNYLSARAFPIFEQTRFLSKTAYAIADDIDRELFERKQALEDEISPEEEEITQEYDEKELNLFDKAQAEFNADPNKYQPGHIFYQYKSLEDECDYRIHLTKTGLIGRIKVRTRRR